MSGNKNEQTRAKLDRDIVWESNDVNLLGTALGNNLKFDKHVSNICSKANRKLSVSARVDKLGKKGCKKGEESDKSVREGKEKGVKEIGGFKRADEEILTEISKENRNKSWRSNIEKIKEANSLDNMGVTSRTEPIINYQQGQNIAKKDHKINN